MYFTIKYNNSKYYTHSPFKTNIENKNTRDKCGPHFHYEQ